MWTDDFNVFITFNKIILRSSFLKSNRFQENCRNKSFQCNTLQHMELDG